MQRWLAAQRARTSVTTLLRWAKPASPTFVSDRSRLSRRRMPSNTAMPASVTALESRLTCWRWASEARCASVASLMLRY